MEGATAKARGTPTSRPEPAALRSRPAVTLEPVVVSPPLHPLEGLTRAQLLTAVSKQPQSLGSLSIGRANRGALYNAVQMPEGAHWKLVDPDRSWATRETVDAVARAIDTVASQIPNTPALFIGDMSRRRGGYFRPHRSHQSGRDADLGYYYRKGPEWYVNADAENLDRPRTWALVKALLAQGNVEYLFMDRSVQDLLEQYALKVEPDPAWIETLFSHPEGKAEGTVRHVPGHRTHMHVRFYNETARETARRTYRLLARYGKL